MTDFLQQKLDDCIDAVGTANAEITRLRALNAELVAALKPFATIILDDYFTAENVRSARAALEKAVQT